MKFLPFIGDIFFLRHARIVTLQCYNINVFFNKGKFFAITGGQAKKLGQQLKYADRRGHRVAVIAGSREFEAGTCQLKDLTSGTSQEIPLEPDAASLIGAISDLLISKAS